LLPARYVIHAVGPRWGEGNEDSKLRSAIENSLKIAEQNQFQTISFPAISSGIFGFPKDRCASIILSAVRDYLQQHPESSLSEVRICLLDDSTLQAFKEQF
jgi:putative ATPase